MIDLEALKSRLANYDPAAPKCPLQIARFVNYAPDHITSLDAEYHDYDETTYVPCCRLEGHEGECQNGRQVMGWPDFETVSQLIAEVERLRSINDDYLLEMGRQHALLRDQQRGENAERVDVVAWLRNEAEAFARTRTERGVQRAKSLTLAASAIEHGEHRREEKP